MKKITAIFMVSFLAVACSTQTPSGSSVKSAVQNQTLQDSSDFWGIENFPTTIYIDKEPLFIADGKLQGYLPYPIMNVEVNKSLYEEQMLMYSLHNNQPDTPLVAMTELYFNVAINDIDGNTWYDNLFDGHQANYTSPFFKNVKADHMNISYLVHQRFALSTWEVAYGADRDNTKLFHRLCYVKGTKYQIEEEFPSGCVAQYLPQEFRMKV